MKTVIITGANSGLGFETAKKIASNKDYELILACRSKEKAEKAKEDIMNTTGNNHIMTMIMDTSSLKSVRNFVEAFKKLNRKLDVLICNAGISSMHSGTTEEGFELVFATNYLGHFLLTNLLLPFMTENARIINVTSDMHNPPMKLEWVDPENIAHMKAENRSRYSYSKLGNIYFTYELDKRLRKINSKIIVNAFNPGMMNTNFSGGHNNPARTAMIKLTMPERVGDLDKSSTALAEVVMNKKFKDITGSYFDRSTTYKNSSDLSYNEENRQSLWNKSVEWTNLKPTETLDGIIENEFVLKK